MRDDAFGAEGSHRLQAMIAVRRPVARLAVFDFFAHDDDRIEKAAELVDHAFKLARVRIGQIALIGRRLDLVDRQRGEEQPLSAERFAVLGEHVAAVLVDGLLKVFDRGR